MNKLFPVVAPLRLLNICTDRRPGRNGLDDGRGANYQRGIPVALESGYEGYVPKTRVVLFEAAMAAANGLSRRDALALITIDAARPQSTQRTRRKGLLPISVLSVLSVVNPFSSSESPVR